MQSDKKNPLISVILPVFNAERYVSQAIESILNQSFSDFELLIADDGSKDKSKKIIDGYAAKDTRIIISHNNTNQGKVKTVNRLFGMCRGEYLTIHDADDYSQNERFKKQILFLKNNPEYGICGTSFCSSLKDGPFTRTHIMPTNYSEIKLNYLYESQVHGPTMMIRLNIIDDVGGLYRNADLFRNYEDVDFTSRVIEKYHVTNLNEPLYFYRNLPHSLSKSGYDFLKFEGMNLIRFLSKERDRNGYDSVSIGGSPELDQFLINIENPYINDRSLFYKKSAANLMYYKFYNLAIKQSLRGIIMEPFRFDNYRTAQYCIRKYLFSFLNKQFNKERLSSLYPQTIKE